MMSQPAFSIYDEQPPQVKSLIARTRDGESDALAEMYRLYAERLMRLAWRLTGSVHDAEDVLHDVFLGLPEALRHYNERGSFESWIKRVTARVALSSIRARKQSRESAIDDHPLIQSAERADAAADAHIVQRAIDGLSEPLRIVFVLKVMEGHSHVEISSLLGISRATSEVRLHRALKVLRAALASMDDNHE